MTRITFKTTSDDKMVIHDDIIEDGILQLGERVTVEKADGTVIKNRREVLDQLNTLLGIAKLPLGTRCKALEKYVEAFCKASSASRVGDLMTTEETLHTARQEATHAKIKVDGGRFDQLILSATHLNSIVNKSCEDNIASAKYFAEQGRPDEAKRYLVQARQSALPAGIPVDETYFERLIDTAYRNAIVIGLSEAKHGVHNNDFAAMFLALDRVLAVSQQSGIMPDLATVVDIIEQGLTNLIWSRLRQNQHPDFTYSDISEVVQDYAAKANVVLGTLTTDVNLLLTDEKIQPELQSAFVQVKAYFYHEGLQKAADDIENGYAASALQAFPRIKELALQAGITDNGEIERLRKAGLQLAYTSLLKEAASFASVNFVTDTPSGYDYLSIAEIEELIKEEVDYYHHKAKGLFALADATPSGNQLSRLRVVVTQACFRTAYESALYCLETLSYSSNKVGKLVRLIRQLAQKAQISVDENRLWTMQKRIYAEAYADALEAVRYSDSEVTDTSHDIQMARRFARWAGIPSTEVEISIKDIISGKHFRDSMRDAGRQSRASQRRAEYVISGEHYRDSMRYAEQQLQESQSQAEYVISGEHFRDSMWDAEQQLQESQREVERIISKKNKK